MNVNLIISLIIFLCLVLSVVFLTNKIKTTNIEIKQLVDKYNLVGNHDYTVKIIEDMPKYRLLVNSMTESTESTQSLLESVKNLDSKIEKVEQKFNQFSTLQTTQINSSDSIQRGIDDKLDTVERIIRDLKDKFDQQKKFNQGVSNNLYSLNQIYNGGVDPYSNNYGHSAHSAHNVHNGMQVLQPLHTIHKTSYGNGNTVDPPTAGAGTGASTGVGSEIAINKPEPVIDINASGKSAINDINATETNQNNQNNHNNHDDHSIQNDSQANTKISRVVHESLLEFQQCPSSQIPLTFSNDVDKANGELEAQILSSMKL